MYGTLFVAHQNVVQCLLMVVESVVGRHYGTARIAEQHIHSLVFQRAHHGFGARYTLALVGGGSGYVLAVGLYLVLIHIIYSTSECILLPWRTSSDGKASLLFGEIYKGPLLNL